jgi:hypothetical protein
MKPPHQDDDEDDVVSSAGTETESEEDGPEAEIVTA